MFWCILYSQRPEESIGLPRTCEPPCMCSGYWTWVLWKSNIVLHYWAIAPVYSISVFLVAVWQCVWKVYTCTYFEFYNFIICMWCIWKCRCVTEYVWRSEDSLLKLAELRLQVFLPVSHPTNLGEICLFWDRVHCSVAQGDSNLLSLRITLNWSCIPSACWLAATPVFFAFPWLVLMTKNTFFKRERMKTQLQFISFFCFL